MAIGIDELVAMDKQERKFELKKLLVATIPHMIEFVPEARLFGIAVEPAKFRWVMDRRVIELTEWQEIVSICWREHLPQAWHTCQQTANWYDRALSFFRKKDDLLKKYFILEQKLASGEVLEVTSYDGDDTELRRFLVLASRYTVLGCFKTQAQRDHIVNEMKKAYHTSLKPQKPINGITPVQLPINWTQHQ